MTVVVARLLTPADFGLFALALVIVNFFDYVKILVLVARWFKVPAGGIDLRRRA